MAEYDEPETPQDQPDEPEAPSAEAKPAKLTQQQANYRESDKSRCCGLCPYFDSKGHSCDVTEGDISCFGFCDQYERQDNPFRAGETGEFTGGTPVPPAAMMPGVALGGPNQPGGTTLAAAGQGPPQSANPQIAPNAVMPPPSLMTMIGGKRYQ